MIISLPIPSATMPHPLWARKRLAQLHPDRDARELLHLTFEVRFGQPDFIHSMFSLAFARQAAVPEIAQVLYRGGQGQIITNARKRNNDTLLFFGELFRHGTSPEGLKVIERMNQIHAHMPITNELNLYTLATLVCEPRRVGRQLTGMEFITDAQFRALYVFWTDVGRHMGIADIPANEHLFYAWYEDFERQHYAHTVAGEAIARALAQEFASRWFPKPLWHIGRQFYFALFDNQLLETFHLKKPAGIYHKLVWLRVNGYLRLLAPLLPDPPDRSLCDHFGRDYRPYSFDMVGVR